MSARQRLLHAVSVVEDVGSTEHQLLSSLLLICCPALEHVGLALPSVVAEMIEVRQWLASRSAHEVEAAVHSLPANARAFKALLDFAALLEVLQSFSSLQLLHFSVELMPPGGDTAAFFTSLQLLFKSLSHQRLEFLQRVLRQTAPNMERLRLTQEEPQVPLAALSLVLSMLKLPVDSLLEFSTAFTSLSDDQLRLLCDLVTRVSTEQVLYLAGVMRAKLSAEGAGETGTASSPSSPALSSSSSTTAEAEAAAAVTQDMSDMLRTSGGAPPMLPFSLMPMEMDDEPAARAPSPVERAARASSPQDASDAPPAAFGEDGEGDNESLRLSIVVQPAPKTVYQRILRPFPSVMLEGADPSANYFVEAQLITNDDRQADCLTGATKVRIANGVFATFKRLKITATTMQLESMFRMQFQLKTYDGDQFSDVEGVKVISDEMEVFSHTHYLNSKKGGAAAQKPVITEVIPMSVSCRGGDKVCILGKNFIKSPKLKVRLDRTLVPANFHEQGTLWAVLPPLPAGDYTIGVSNDAVTFVYAKEQLSYI